MKPQNLAVLTAFVLSLPALAWADSKADANGDGVLTIDEVQAAFPEVNAEVFSSMDANADGMLDQDEVAAAQQAGLIPATEG